MSVTEQWSVRWGLEAIGGLAGPSGAAKARPATRIHVGTAPGWFRVTIRGRRGQVLLRHFRNDARGRLEMSLLLQAQPPPRWATVEASATAEEAPGVAAFLRDECGCPDIEVLGDPTGSG